MNYMLIPILQTSLNPSNEIEILNPNQQKLDYNTIFNEIIAPMNNYHQGDVEWIIDEGIPKIRLNYWSYYAYENAYSRELKILDLLLDLLVSGQVLIPPEEKINRIDSSELYLILQVRTHYKSPIRNIYRMGEKIARMLNIHAWVEEIDDGFLHFFHRRQDFEDWFFDLQQPEKVREFLLRQHIHVSEEGFAQYLKLLNVNLSHVRLN